MTTILLLAAALGSSVTAPQMVGARLQPGSSCYAIMAGDKAIGTTAQTIVAATIKGKRAWDIVVHQRLANGSFDMRDHFVVDRATMLPIHMDSQRGVERSARGWHRISLDYATHRVRGTRETASATQPIDVRLSKSTWDGNLWGLTFAALPLHAGGSYTLPFWQYDKGLGTFIVRVVGSEDVETPAGRKAAWIVEAGDDPAKLVRYTIGKAPRQELGYSAGATSQHLVAADRCAAGRAEPGRPQG